MFIYIDESGTFSHPQRDRHAYACAGALTIPERRHGPVLKSFKTLTRHWGRIGQEIKGRELNERQVNEVIRLLDENHVKFHACVTDMLLNTKELLEFRKKTQAEYLLAHITDQHHPNLVHKLRDIGTRICEMSDQLFVQLCMMIHLVNAQLHDVMIYFAKYGPEDLGTFRWIADRKNDRETSYEDLWQTLLPFFIQGRQFADEFEDKIVFLKGGNYDYCKRFFLQVDKWPNYLPEPKPGIREKNGIDIVDIRPILKESFTLADSRDRLGLQLADVVTNALRRALIGNLQADGWTDLGRLMFRWKDNSVRLVHFGDGKHKHVDIDDEHVARVIMEITKKAGFVL